MRLVLSIFAMLSALGVFCNPIRSNVGATHIAYGEHEEPRNYTASDYVQDGLVCLLDGIENVGLNEHDNTATAWVNLVNGGGSEALGDRTWNADSLNTAGHLGLSWGNPPAVQDSESNSRTIEVVFSTHETSVQVVLISLGTRRVIGCTENSIGIGPYHAVPIVSISDAVWGVTVTYPADSNSPSAAYVNGSLVTERTGGNFTNPVSNAIFIGGYYSKPFSGTVFCIRMYSRELSAEEVAWNNKVDRARFGL